VVTIAGLVGYCDRDGGPAPAWFHIAQLALLIPAVRFGRVAAKRVDRLCPPAEGALADLPGVVAGFGDAAGIERGSQCGISCSESE